MGSIFDFGDYAVSRVDKMTNAAVKSAYEREAVDDFVRLIELTFGDDPKKYYYSSKAVDHLLDEDGFPQETPYGVPIMGMYHNGIFYELLPFDLPGLSYENEKAPDTSITVEGLSAVLIPLLRPITGKISCSMILVHTSDPDVEQERIDNLLLVNINGDCDNDVISGELTLDILTSVGYPCDIYTPDRFSGMF